MTMTVNTAYELQKSRGMRNRNHLIRQKVIDGAAREKKELERQRKIAKKEKILRQLSKPKGSYEAVIPTAREMMASESTKNSNQDSAVAECVAILEQKEAEVKKALEEGEAVAEEDLVFIEDFVTCPAKAVQADEWELVC